MYLQVKKTKLKVVLTKKDKPENNKKKDEK